MKLVKENADELSATETNSKLIGTNFDKILAIPNFQYIKMPTHVKVNTRNSIIEESREELKVEAESSLGIPNPDSQLEFQSI